MERFEKIWISSESHIENFNVVKRNKKILTNTLDLKIESRFYDFPRTQMSGNIFPVIFESLGHLIITDSGIQFYTNVYETNNTYLGINKNENIIISFEQIENIELVKRGSSFISYFENTWIKILYKASVATKNILISNSGKGFVMKKIKKRNAELMELIGAKIK